MGEPEKRPKIYKTWAIDSTRWRQYQPREGDVVIGTYPKCRTTWMQRIVDLLIFQSPEPRPINEVSSWIDMRFGPPIESVIGRIERQVHRRFLKSHLPFDGLPRFSQVRYIHVARDGRDACMSYFNHCSAYTPQMYEAFDRAGEDIGQPTPRCPRDVQTFWHEWLTKGVLPGTNDGFPGLSFFSLESTYWRARRTPNLLLVHYNDLKAGLEGEMRRIAAFLSIEIKESMWPLLIEAATFDRMKQQGTVLLPQMDGVFEGGSDRFLFKGSNGRWQEAISSAEIALYGKKAADRFTPGLARWVENGRQAAGDPRTASD